MLKINFIALYLLNLLKTGCWKNVNLLKNLLKNKNNKKNSMLKC